MKKYVKIFKYLIFLSNRQREFHPKPLAESYLTVSRHTALQIPETISGLKFSLSSSSVELTK